MTKLRDRRVLITGGASGIGKIMGRLALERGASHLIIWDINEASIEVVKKEFSSLGTVLGYRVDVSDNEAIYSAYETVKKDCGGVDVLINCAGIVTSNKTFEFQTEDEIERTMRINSVAPMIIAKAILPDMIKADMGHICNIASAAGMISNPKMSVYVASKWAVIGWSDSVRIELHQAHSNVRITTIAPYFINTGMFDGVNSRIFPILNAENTSRKIMDAIEKNHDFRGIPFGFHFIRFWQGVLPTALFDFIFGKCFGIFSAMDHFTGRNR